MKLVTTGVGPPLKVSVHFSIFLMLLMTLLPASFTILFYLGNGVVELGPNTQRRLSISMRRSCALKVLFNLGGHREHIQKWSVVKHLHWKVSFLKSDWSLLLCTLSVPFCRQMYVWRPFLFSHWSWILRRKEDVMSSFPVNTCTIVHFYS